MRYAQSHLRFLRSCSKVEMVRKLSCQDELNTTDASKWLWSILHA